MYVGNFFMYVEMLIYSRYSPLDELVLHNVDHIHDLRYLFVTNHPEMVLQL